MVLRLVSMLLSLVVCGRVLVGRVCIWGKVQWSDGDLSGVDAMRVELRN